MIRTFLRGFFLALAVSALIATWGSVASAQAFPPPPGGWTYICTGDSAGPGSGADDAFDALDGTWGHDNGSDSWDGSVIGAGKPGGASSIDGVLRIQDTGNPGDYGFGPDPSNRKLYFAHNVTADSAVEKPLDLTAILSFRARVATDPPLDDLHPDDGSGIVPWPAGGNGYLIHDGGKGNFGIGQANGNELVSFSLVTAAQAAPLRRGSGLLMNNLYTGEDAYNVDTDDLGNAGVALNHFDKDTGAPADFDATDWHEFWIEISPSAMSTDLVSIYQVAIYLDGDTSGPAGIFDVRAGDGNDSGGPEDFGYIAMGLGSTGQYGAIDIDFFAVKVVPEPNTVVMALLFFGILAALWRRG